MKNAFSESKEKVMKLTFGTMNIKKSGNKRLPHEAPFARKIENKLHSTNGLFS